MKQLHNSLKMQENGISIDHLKIVGESFPDQILIINQDTEVLWANRYFLDASSYDIEAVTQKKLTDLIGFSPRNLLLAFELGKSYEGEYPTYQYNHLEYYELRLTPIIGTSYFLFSQRNITERKLEETQRKEQEGMLQSVIFNNDDAVFLLDRALNLSQFNNAFAKWLEKHEGSTPHPRINFLTLIQDRKQSQRWEQRLQKALRGYHGNFLDQLVVGSEQYFYDIKIYPITLGDEITGVSVFAQDVTKKQQTEAALKNAKERAEDASRAKTQFLSTMSHEIRTPMNAVIGLAHLLLQENPKDEQKENLKTLMFSAENLLVLINDILDFNKVEAGKIVLEKTDFSLSELLRSIKRSFRPKAEEKGIKLHVIRDNNTHDMLIGDPVRLGQVLNNLVSNAIKFTEKGQVELHIFCQAQNEKKVKLRFEITDTGIGIPTDRQDIIFDVFTQSGNDTTRKFGGSGLGLAITKRLLALFRSEIELESIVGEGSKFAFDVSFDKSKKLQLNENHYNHEKASFQALKGLRVLLAEDNEINQMLARKFLQSWGIELDFAQNGKIALEKFSESHQEQPYHLILMDLQMPEVDGYETTRKIREQTSDYAQKIPIIALTADAFSDVKYKVLQSGMNDYISKPFNPNELYNKISSFTRDLNFATIPNSSIASQAEINFQNIIDLAANDAAYLEELKNLYIKFLTELGQDFSQVMYAHDLVALRALAHKVQPSLKFLELQEIEEAIVYARQLIEENAEEKAIDRLVVKLQQACQRALNELKSH